jgi:hypothetical protein
MPHGLHRKRENIGNTQRGELLRLLTEMRDAAPTDGQTEEYADSYHGDLLGFDLFLTYLRCFEKMKVGLCDFMLHVCQCPPSPFPLTSECPNQSLYKLMCSSCHVIPHKPLHCICTYIPLSLLGTCSVTRSYCGNEYARNRTAGRGVFHAASVYFFLSLFIKNSNLVYTNKPFVSNLICYCEFTKYLFRNNHFGSDNISALT